jgi:hypothetical protein
MSSESLSTKVERLTERVNNHITFFKFALVVLGGWLAWVSVMLYQTHSTIGNLAQVQANAPAQTVASILNKPVATPNDAQTNLLAASSILQASKIGKVKPDPEKLKAISDRLVEDQNRYPEMPQVWETTGVFINYKSGYLLQVNHELSLQSPLLDCRNGGGMVLNGGVMTVTHCELSLEHGVSVSPSTILVFVDCIVHYSGGEMPKSMMVFRNSIFRFDVPVVPPPRGAQTMRLIAESETPELITVPQSPATHS